ncbi:hypothetical protein KSZ_20940 [Dictyobacter formicarum]|uniref:Uncharacterized protein n=1 Tax=Dictyobacter formicarum TaxID=2778368 RepID=A0ABQ3VE39_9CHLR|nr:hypothetical protein KSZ_20940 [Dictyobacter formicarum]
MIAFIAPSRERYDIIVESEEKQTGRAELTHHARRLLREVTLNMSIEEKSILITSTISHETVLQGTMLLRQFRRIRLPHEIS